MNIARNVERAALHFPEKPAVIFEGRRLTYADLDRLSGRAARGLAGLGVGAGDRVALFLPNIPEFVVAYAAIQKIGAVAVNLNVMLTTEELAYFLEDSGARTVFTTAELWPRLGPLAGTLVRRERVIICEGEAAGMPTIDALADAGGPLPARPMDPNAPAAILYTSGTTGRQKGATLSHANVVTNTFTVDRYLGLGRDDRVLITTPLFHVAAQNVLMNAALNVAATIVLERRFDVQRCVAAIAEHGVTYTLLVPTIYIAMLDAGVDPRALASVRIFKSGAATLPVEVADRWRARYGITIVEGYGLSETSPAATFNHEHEHRPGSVGTAVDAVDMRVVDEEDQDVASGAWGEVVFRGPNVMLGYWGRSDETAVAMRGGWFHSGDIGHLDDAGYLYLVDRVKDMINTAGFKVWPREVEEVLYLHPAVRECAVVGMRDDVKGELAKAFIVLASGPAPTEADLDAHCRVHLAAYKAPRAYAIVGSLPKSATGKILKRVLRDTGSLQSS